MNWRPRFKVSHLSYTSCTDHQYQTIVKVPGSFRPAARNEHLYAWCNFAELVVEAAPKSLLHSCRSELTRQGISLPQDGYSYLCRLLGLKFSASLALTLPLNLPAPGRSQSVYIVFQLGTDLCF